MVYPGKQSSGCSLCRRRKIKCDEHRPECKHCQRYGVSCPGYDRPFAVRFHTKPRRSLVRELAREDKRSYSDDPPLLGLIGHPKPCLEDESLAYFFQEHCIYPGPGVVRGHLDFLQSMYTSARRDSCLKQAVLATAFIALSRRYKSSALYLTARTHYGAALRAVNLTLFSPSRIRQEETLASLMLLGMIEDIDYHGPSAKSTHMLGIAKLCEVVGRRPLTRIEESSLDEWMFKELELHSLVAGDYLDCLAIPNTSLDGKKPVTRVAVTVARIGQFCRDFKNSRPLQESALEAKHLETLMSIVEQATVVQHELSEIDSSLLPEWSHHNTTDEWHTDERGSQLPAYPSRWIATARSLFQVSSILFFTKFVSCCRTLLELDHNAAYAYHPRHETKTSLTLAEAQLVRLIHMLCATMPYLMGEVDEQGNSVAVPVHKAVIMYHLIWPLAFVNASAWSTRQQVQDARRRLDIIQEQYGIKLASAAPEMARSILD